MTAPSPRHRTLTRTLRMSGVVMLLTMGSFVLLQYSQAAIGGILEGDGDPGGARVELGSSQRDDVAFNLGNMVPGDTSRTCVEVSYEGDVPAEIRLYGSTTVEGDDLGEYLDLTIDEVVLDGTDCETPREAQNLYDGVLAVRPGAFTERHTDWSTGLATSFVPTDAGDRQTYRLTVTLQADNAAQGLGTMATFVWEAVDVGAP